MELAAGTIPYSGIFNRIDQRTLAEKTYGTTASKNNPLGERKAIFLWVPSYVLSLIGQNPPHGIVIPYDLHAGCIIGHFGKSSGKPGPPWVQSGQT